ncbi:tetratricopeptide repeat protein [Kutzneria sp. CA-103260]|uniref:tetratricopeptide repeat protein n=1 Tax=Kutzneria sp. CA-103260 TaxID=2802641 RepID=UPI001BA88633|nr:hypothetical protein [Kutzneria sp. CA-103260]
MVEGPAERDPEDAARVDNSVQGSAANVVQVGSAGQISIYQTPPEASPVAPGRPLSECSPYDLEVHRAANVGEAETPAALPAYIQRAHDQRLDSVVAAAAAGHSAMAVLVGGSSTGKTRACWEAIQALAVDWRLWHPINPGRPEAVLADLAGISPATVVWLNETHHYLRTPGSDLGERVAAGVRELLRDPARRPVLVLGTLWPEYWNLLAQVPPGGAEDPHAQARALLTGMSITVPDMFTEAEMRTARLTKDERLILAVNHAQDGEVTQYLAGAPALVERYQHAPPAARALLSAAIDARRLGHGLFLSVDLLAAAAPSYLTQSQWDQLPDDWLTAGLQYVETPCPGGTRPLVRVRPKPGQDVPAQGRLRLADYLEQTGRRTRATIPPPAAVWETLLAEASAEDSMAIGAAAEQRGLYSLAFRFYGRAGDDDAALRRGLLLHRCGRLPEAEPYCRRAAEAGIEPGIPLAVEVLLNDGRSPEANMWLHQVIVDGHAAASRLAAQAFERAGLTDDAADWYQRAGEAGDAMATRRYAQHLVGAGRSDDAAIWLRSLADEGNRVAANLARVLAESQLRVVIEPASTDEDPDLDADPSTSEANAALNVHVLIALRLATEGRPDEAFDAFQKSVELAKPAAEVQHDRATSVTEITERAVFETLKALQEQNRRVQGIEWLRRMIDGGEDGALMPYAGLLADVGRADEAIDWYQRAAEVPRTTWYVTRAFRRFTTRLKEPAVDYTPHRRAAQLMHQIGRTDAALDWLAGCVTDADPDSRLPHVELLLAADRITEAIAGYQSAIAAGSDAAMDGLLEFAFRHDRQAEIKAWIEQRIDAGDAAVRRTFAVVLADGDQQGKAIALLTPLAEAGDQISRDRLIDLMIGDRRLDEAIALLTPLARAGAQVAFDRVVDVLIDDRRLNEALEWLHGPCRGEAKDRRLDIATHFENAGRVDDAIALYRRLAEEGDTHALIRAALLAERNGQTDQILAWLRGRVDAGDTTALRLTAELSERSGRPEEAIRWYRRVVEAGNPSGLERLTHLLRQSDQAEEADSLRRYGLVPGGTTAEPWPAAD